MSFTLWTIQDLLTIVALSAFVAIMAVSYVRRSQP